MNQLNGHITAVKTEGTLSMVSVDVKGVNLKAIVIDTPTTVNYLNIEHPINILFKETEVIIAKGTALNISLRNQLAGKVVGLDKGKLLSTVSIEGNWGDLTSIITTNAVEELKITLGEEIIALIKTTEMMLAPC